MAVSSEENPTIVLYGLDWEQCRQIVDALGAYHPRHAYDGSNLELRRVLHGVTWDDYCAFLNALGDRGVRHTYDGWTLEMMSPRNDHDWISHLIGRFIEFMAMELDVSIQSVGSMTLSSPTVKKSVQPDQTYYVTHEAFVRGKITYDPDVDPPPDLILEVDVTSTSVPRMEIFAALGIPEVWRHDAKALHFYRRDEAGVYAETETSGEFPWLKPTDIVAFLDQHRGMNENNLVRAFAKHAVDCHRIWQTGQSS